MLKQEEIDQLQPTIRNIQIICFALITGLLIAAALFCAITDWTTVHTGLSGVLVLAGMGFGLIGATVAFVVPNLISNAALDSSLETDRSTKHLIGIFQNKTIIQFALLEGPAFFNLIVFLVEHSLVSLGVVAFLVAVMAILFPRSDSIFTWIEDQLN